MLSRPSPSQSLRHPRRQRLRPASVLAPGQTAQFPRARTRRRAAAPARRILFRTPGAPWDIFSGKSVVLADQDRPDAIDEEALIKPLYLCRRISDSRQSHVLPAA